VPRATTSAPTIPDCLVALLTTRGPVELGAGAFVEAEAGIETSEVEAGA
jgi:hypothetical protein